MKKIITLLILLSFVSCGRDSDTLSKIIEQVEIESELDLTGKIISKELIVNGSFEEGHGLGDGKWNVFAEIPGWKADLETIDAPIEIQNGQSIGAIAPSDGDAKLELDSHARSGFSASDAIVYQEVFTVAGEKYFFKLDYTPRTNNCNESCSVEIYFDGVHLYTLESDTKAWDTYTFVLDGTGRDSRIEFRAIQDTNTIGGYIDNVSLKLDLNIGI